MSDSSHFGLGAAGIGRGHKPVKPFLFIQWLVQAHVPAFRIAALTVKAMYKLLRSEIPQLCMSSNDIRLTLWVAHVLNFPSGGTVYDASLSMDPLLQCDDLKRDASQSLCPRNDLPPPPLPPMSVWVSRTNWRLTPASDPAVAPSAGPDTFIRSGLTFSPGTELQGLARRVVASWLSCARPGCMTSI